MALLTLTYRPRRFADLVGQPAARGILQALVHAGDIPPSLIFGGPSGTGKTSAARILAAALNCAEPANGDACGHCPSCQGIAAGTFLAVHEVDAASQGGVEDIRALVELTRFSLSTERWRVVILDEAHALSRQSFTALLKILEEPPPATTFLLLTTEPDKILPTIRTRSMPLTFQAVPVTEVVNALQTICQAEKIPAEPELLTMIARHAEGGVREAVMLLDQARRVEIATASDFRALLGISPMPEPILAALLSNATQSAHDHLVTYFTQTATLAPLITWLIGALQDRYLNHDISAVQLIAATKLLWEARSLTGTGRDIQAQAQALITLLGAILSKNDSKPDAPILRARPATSERLSLQQVAEVLSSP